MDDPDIRCQSCARYGAKAFRGWQLLCQKCINAEIGEYFDDRLHYNGLNSPS